MSAGPGELLLAIDVGTQSVRALLFDAAGQLRGRVHEPLVDYQSPQPGWHEIDAERVWQAATVACRTLWRDQPALRSAVAAIAVTGQRGTLVPLDGQGRPLVPAITWKDRRRAGRVPPLPLVWRTLFTLARAADVVRHLQSEAEVNWWAEHEGPLLARAAKVMLLSGLLNWRLTGRCADATAAQVGYLPFDFRRQAWSRPRDWRWRALALRRDQCPDLVETGQAIGSLAAEAARQLELPAGVPVIAAGADKACELLGAGGLTPERACIAAGTATSINVCTPRYAEALPFSPAYPALMPGRFCQEIQTHCGFWLVSWFLAEFGQPEREEAARRGLPAEALFDALAAGVPAGALGLVLQPHWAPGVRHPAPEARGSIIGFGLPHGRAHLARALLEGQAYAMREGRERIERTTGVRIERLCIVGGGSRSDLVMQIFSDVLGLSAARLHTPEAAGLGAAMAAAVGVGLHADLTRAAQAMVHEQPAFQPRPAEAALYERVYREVYRPLYPQLAPLYGRLARLWGAKEPGS